MCVTKLSYVFNYYLFTWTKNQSIDKSTMWNTQIGVVTRRKCYYKNKVTLSVSKGHALSLEPFMSVTCCLLKLLVEKGLTRPSKISSKNNFCGISPLILSFIFPSVTIIVINQLCLNRYPINLYLYFHRCSFVIDLVYHCFIILVFCSYCPYRSPTQLHVSIALSLFPAYPPIVHFSRRYNRLHKTYILINFFFVWNLTKKQ